MVRDEKLDGGGTLEMEVTTERIYRDKELALASFLGGPLAIGYLIAENSCFRIYSTDFFND